MNGNLIFFIYIMVIINIQFDMLKEILIVLIKRMENFVMNTYLIQI